MIAGEDSMLSAPFHLERRKRPIEHVVYTHRVSLYRLRVMRIS